MHNCADFRAEADGEIALSVLPILLTEAKIVCRALAFAQSVKSDMPESEQLAHVMAKSRVELQHFRSNGRIWNQSICSHSQPDVVPVIDRIRNRDHGHDNNREDL